MTEPKFVLETGMQLLARLIKRPNIENVYPVLFSLGPKNGDFIEVNNDSSSGKSWMLMDIICEAILKDKVEVLFFNTDGNLNYNILIKVMTKKIISLHKTATSTDINDLLHKALCKFHMLEIFDANQFLVTIHNLENILLEHNNICLIIFDSLTAFYWSQQGFKIIKMDLYVKNLLQIIQKITKQYKITCIYTKPDYFISSIEIEMQSVSYSSPTIQYQINLHHLDKECHEVNVKMSKKHLTAYFRINDGTLNWQS